MISIVGVAKDVGELVAEGLSYEGGGGESAVDEGDGLVWGLVGVFAKDGFYKGPIFGVLLEEEELNFGCPDLAGVGGYG